MDPPRRRRPGFKEYYRSAWNVADSVVVVAGGLDALPAMPQTGRRRFAPDPALLSYHTMAFTPYESLVCGTLATPPKPLHM